MSLSFAREFACQVYIKSGTQTREKFVDVQKVAAAVGQNTCCAIPGLHSFTVCKRFWTEREDQCFLAYAEEHKVPRCNY